MSTCNAENCSAYATSGHECPPGHGCKRTHTKHSCPSCGVEEPAMVDDLRDLPGVAQRLVTEAANAVRYINKDHKTKHPECRVGSLACGDCQIVGALVTDIAEIRRFFPRIENPFVEISK